MAGRYAGKQMAKRAVGKEFKRQSKHLATPNNMLPNNVGWGPRQSIHVVHDTDAPTKLTLYSPERWDAIHEGAPEAGIKVNLAIQEQQLITLYQVRQRRQLRLEREICQETLQSRR